MSAFQNTTSEVHAQTKNDIGRLVIAVLSIFLEIGIILAIVFWMASWAAWIFILFRVIAFILVIYIYSRRVAPAMKMPWLLVMTLLPIFGATLYLLVGHNRGTSNMRKRYRTADDMLLPLLPENSDVIEKSAAFDKRVANINKFILGSSGYPVYDNTRVTYFDDGAKGIEAQKEELRRAKKFIFMEYFAIEDTTSWRAVEEILAERAKAGVEVRVFYDDIARSQMSEEDKK